MKKRLIIGIITFLVIAGALIFYAYAGTWGKTELEIKIKINEKLVHESAFGESPTFAIWLENPVTKSTNTIFATRRAAQNDWEGKAEVPTAIPLWFDINESGNTSDNIDAFTGATPRPGYFITRAKLTPGSIWICWIEVNLAGDFNEFYQQIDLKNKTNDEYLSGQPSLLYKTEIPVSLGKVVRPEIAGMSVLNPDNTVSVQPLKGITTAQDIFSEIELRIVKPKPKIFNF